MKGSMSGRRRIPSSGIMCLAGVFLLLAVSCYARQGGSYPLPARYASERYTLLDVWHETLGVFPDTVTVAEYKLYDTLRNAGIVVMVDAEGTVLSPREARGTLQAEVEFQTPFDPTVSPLPMVPTPVTPVIPPSSRVHPRLMARFQAPEPGLTIQAEHKEIVHVWLVEPQDRPFTPLAEVPDFAVGGEENAPEKYTAAEQMLDAVRAAEQDTLRIRAAVKEHFQAIVQRFIQQQGIPEAKIVYRYQYAPAVALQLTLAECLELGASDQVNFLFPDDTFVQELDKIAPAMKAPGIWAKGYNGSGVKIAHIEIEPGRIETANPYLSASAYRPGGAVNEHATVIGGIIRSTHASYKGVAHGCTLLSANAAATQAGVIAATEWALNQGADVLNMSAGLDYQANDGGALNWSDIYFDYVAYHSRALFTKSAGNSSTDNPWRITSPGRGYNSLTVGNIDGRRTTSWLDDVMEGSSCYGNPVTEGDKPEIAAYGTDVYSTTTSYPWVGGAYSGTSFAAPVVAGIAGLIIDRDPSLAFAPEVVKAMILVSGLAHNIEGDSRLSDKDGAGAALATATLAGYRGLSLHPNSFDAGGYYELNVDIPLSTNDPKRVVLVYMHPLPTQTALPDPSSYLRSDLDLHFYVGGIEVKSSSHGVRNPFEIIDYTPTVSGTGRVKIRKHSWHDGVAGIPVGIAWASRSTLGTASD